MTTVQKSLVTFLGILLLLSSHLTTTFADITVGSTTSLFIAPRPSDYSVQITNDRGSGPIIQNIDITYTITYSASSSAAVTTDDTITADFSQDTSDTFTHVTDYILGTATNGYGGAVPIVDLVNRTITWNISQMPQGTTDQIVSFTLRTNANYTQFNVVPITVKTTFSNQYVKIQNADTTSYQFHRFPPPPTPTPTPIASITPSLTPTPTTPIPLAITAMQVTQISANAVTIRTTTNKKTHLRAFYGLSPQVRLQDISDDTLSTVHTLTFTGLSPSTTYYMQVTAADNAFESVTSDMLKFKTAKSSAPLTINPNQATIVGSGSLIATQTLTGLASTLLSTNQIYSIGLHLPQLSLKSIAAIVTNKTLGVNTFTKPDQNIPSIWSVPLREKNPGFYVTELAAPPQPGAYEVAIRAQDDNGNISQSNIAELTVYGPFLVLNKATQKPIDHARIFIYEYNNATKRYESNLYSQTQNNPTFTDTNGNAQLNTGDGKYKIVISQYGYKAQTLTFSLTASHPVIPTIQLEPIGFDFLENIKDSTQSISDLSNQLVADVQSISSTSRFFSLISTLVLLSLILITFLLFVMRTRISLLVIPLFIKHHALKARSVHGQILDILTHQPIALATIAVCNKATQEVIATITSNTKGIFYLNSSWVNSDNILNILAQGYNPNKYAINSDIFPAVIYLHHNPVGGPLHNPLINILVDFGGMLFETLLVLSFITEIFFIQTIGTWGILFTLLSLLNLLLYLFYQKEHH